MANASGQGNGRDDGIAASRSEIQPLLDQAVYAAALLEQAAGALKNLTVRLERAKAKEDEAHVG